MSYKDLIEFDKYISPDGTEYNLTDGVNRFVMSFTGYGMPAINYLSQRGPFQHGETIFDYRLEPRVMQLVFRHQDCGRDAYWANRNMLIDMLRPNRQTIGEFSPGILRKTLSDGSLRDINVFIEQGPVFQARSLDRWDEWAFTETLRFIAPDPTFFDPTVGCLNWSLAIAQSDLVFPITFPITFGYTILGGVTNNITYQGTWDSFPTITITGPVSGFALENTTINERIALNYSVAAGETVTISLEYGNKTVVSDVAGNIIGTVTPDSTLSTFRIAADPAAPGGVNDFEINGAAATADTYVVLSYYTRYIGI